MHWLSNACTLTQSLRKARGTLQCQVKASFAAYGGSHLLSAKIVPLQA